MKILHGLRSAALEDGASAVWGLAAPAVHLAGHSVPIIAPISSLFLLVREIKQRTKLVTVDWDLQNWRALYHRELSKTLDVQYREVRYHLPQILLHENQTGQPLSQQPIKFVIDRQPFKLSPTVAAHTARGFDEVMSRLRGKRTHYEETSIRLIGIQDQDGELLIEVQPVTYSDYLRTNLLLDYCEKNRSSLRQVVHPAGSVESLPSSVLANPMGVNVLIFTADGRLVLQKRSQKVGVRPGEYAPSGSGGMTFADAETANGGAVKPVTIMREVTEEIGVVVDPAIEKTLTYLGTTRELIRGGMPDMFFFAQSEQSEASILQSCRSAKDRYEFARVRIFSAGEFAQKDLTSMDDAHALSVQIDRLFDRIWNAASIPLLTAMALWVRHKRLKIGALPQIFEADASKGGEPT